MSGWSRDRILEAIDSWVAEHGQVPRARDWTLAGARSRVGRDAGSDVAEEQAKWPAAQMVMKVFGSWKAGLDEAGYAPARGAQVNPRLRKWSDEEMLEMMRETARRQGSVPSMDSWDRNRQVGQPAGETFRKRFGSWTEALKAAGLDRHHGVDRIHDFLETVDQATLSEISKETGLTENTVREYMRRELPRQTVERVDFYRLK